MSIYGFRLLSLFAHCVHCTNAKVLHVNGILQKVFMMDSPGTVRFNRVFTLENTAFVNVLTTVYPNGLQLLL
jgi:hypothetical protein